VARIEAGLQAELTHGNLDSTRTLIDVRDAMRAYWMAAERCEPGGVYNIGGAAVVTVGQFLETLRRLARTPIPARLDPALLRPADVTLQVPSVRRFVEATGWAAEYDFDRSVEHLLDHWRAGVARTAGGAREGPRERAYA
jgi:nucleoside-diphosphate-sugar epimerase